MSKNTKTMPLRRTALAIAVGLGFVGLAHGQATTGAIRGSAPAGSTVVVQNVDTGLNRTVTVDQSGHYSVTALPLGRYSVTLQQNGSEVARRDNVNIRVSQTSDVSFASSETRTLEGVTVTASSLPAIDTTTLDTRTVLNAQQLRSVPLPRNITAAATLAPGVVLGDSRYGNVPSFGGGSVSENAYYINGYNVTNPLTNIGYLQLPYGTIDQLEILTGGYSAAYGHSTGGVINQIGKRGNNDWHFGGQILWQPKWAREGNPNAYYKYGDNAGQLLDKNDKDKAWSWTTSAYIGGPLIKDTLFFFLAGEFERQEQQVTTDREGVLYANAGGYNKYTYKDPRWYGKLDWNINDSNILEFTYASDKDKRDAFTQYSYDYDERHKGDFIGYGSPYKNSTELYVAKYTSYITDDLTFNAMWGKTKVVRYQGLPQGVDPNLSGTSGITLQDPSITGGTPIPPGQPRTAMYDPDRHDGSRGIRLELEYKAGDSHTLLGGFERQVYNTWNQGTTYTGGGYWVYGKSPSGTTPVNSALGIGPAGGQGYWVDHVRNATLSNAQTDQEAYYLEDRWQITDRFLLSVGLRHEAFKNYNNDKVVYVKQLAENAPRIGFSWDVNGDSTFKIFGNAGRYYLAMPSNVAIRAANGSYYTEEYFAYSGIDANGLPTGLRPIGPGEVSANNEFGQAKDPRTVAARGLKPEYQDEYILGFEKAFNPEWTYGAKLTFRNLRNAIDDMCPYMGYQPFADYLGAHGIPYELGYVSGCFLFNPGKANSFMLDPLGTGDYQTFKLSNADLGFPRLKRRYYALDTFLEHPFDGKWYGKLEYTFSRSYGNAEGQTKSDIGQADVSVTQDWDSPYMMFGANGPLPNDRTHQIKAYGFYQITPEWQVGARTTIQSGRPKNCLGYWGNGDGTTVDIIGYHSSYQFCEGAFAPRGSKGRYPWTEQLDLNVAYRPAFADHKLAFTIDVFNVFDSNKVTSAYEQAEVAERGRDPITGQLDPVPYDPAYEMPLSYMTPRYVRFGITYDF